MTTKEVLTQVDLDRELNETIAASQATFMEDYKAAHAGHEQRLAEARAKWEKASDELKKMVAV